MDPWREFLNNFARWLQLTCYIALAWVFFDLLAVLPPPLVNRIIDGLLSRFGL